MDGEIDPRRRAFLTGGLPARPAILRPPWLAEKASASCTGCGACAEACPRDLVSLADGQPTIAFTGGECIFCGACAESCPEDLFDREGRAFAHRIVVGDDCLGRRGVICEVCRDACPEGAIRFAPRSRGPFLPEIAGEKCSGCGACIAPCPTSAIAARPGGAHG